MSKTKYIAEIDKALIDFAESQKSEDIPNKLSFSEAQVKSGEFKKYAFDVYKVDNDPYESLWLRQDCDDGSYLVRASLPENEKEDNGDWSAISDKLRSNVTLNYKGIPIARFSSDEYNFGPEEAITFKSALLDRAENDSDFLKGVFSSQPDSKREALVTAFPEFKKFI